MKILIYDAYAKSQNSPPRGGSTKSLVDFLRVNTINSKHEYFFLTNQLNRKYYQENIKPLGVKELYIEFPKAFFAYGKKYEANIWNQIKLLLFSFPSLILKLSRTLREGKFDKIVANEIRASLTVGIPALIANKELITFVRSDYGVGSKITKFGLSVSSKIISISQGIYDLLDSKSKTKTNIINESLDINSFIGNYRRKEGKDVINIINVANIAPYKNQITLIKAMKEILKKNHRVHLYIIGEEFDKECKREMLEVIKENNLEKYITFTGFETDIRSYLEKCDIYVQPSFNEGLGRSIIEAYLFSIPTIGSDIPGIRSIVKNDFNGLLFDPSNHIELSQKILTLIENDKMRTNFGKQGRQFVCQHFNLEENSKKIEEYIIE